MSSVIVCKCANLEHTVCPVICEELHALALWPRVLCFQIATYAASTSWTELDGVPRNRERTTNADDCTRCQTRPNTRRDLVRIFAALEQFAPCMTYSWTDMASETVKYCKSVRVYGADLARPTIACDRVERFLRDYAASSALCKSVRIRACANSERAITVCGARGYVDYDRTRNIVLRQYRMSCPWCVVATLFCCPCAFCFWCLIETPVRFELELETYTTLTHQQLLRKYTQESWDRYNLVTTEETDGDGITRTTSEWKIG